LNHLPLGQGFALVALNDEPRGSYGDSDNSKANHIEFINFNMADVKEKLHRKLGELKYISENKIGGLALQLNPEDLKQTIIDFIEVCNFYLQPNKEMVYDEPKFEVFIRLKKGTNHVDFNPMCQNE
jgi:hypothetical protein